VYDDVAKTRALSLNFVRPEASPAIHSGKARRRRLTREVVEDGFVGARAHWYEPRGTDRRAAPTTGGRPEPEDEPPQQQTFCIHIQFPPSGRRSRSLFKVAISKSRSAGVANKRPDGP